MCQAQDGWDVLEWNCDLLLGLAHIHELGRAFVWSFDLLHVPNCRGAAAIFWQHLESRRLCGDALDAVDDALHDAQGLA